MVKRKERLSASKLKIKKKSVVGVKTFINESILMKEKSDNLKDKKKGISTISEIDCKIKPVFSTTKKIQVKKIDLLATKVVALKQQQQTIETSNLKNNTLKNDLIKKINNKSLFYQPKYNQQQTNYILKV